MRCALAICPSPAINRLTPGKRSSQAWKRAERERLFLFIIWQEASSQQALRSSPCSDSIRISEEMAEINALKNWPVCRGGLELQEKKQSSEAGVLVVISGRSQRETPHNPSLLSHPHQEWKRMTVLCPIAARHTVETDDTILLCLHLQSINRDNQ